MKKIILAILILAGIYLDLSVTQGALTYYYIGVIAKNTTLAWTEMMKYQSPIFVLGSVKTLIWPVTVLAKQISANFFMAQGLYVAGIVGVAVLNYEKIFRSGAAIREKGEEYGSARWARISDLKKILTNGPVGTILGTMKGQTLFLPIIVKFFNQNIMVVGSSGSGKTWSILLPAVMQAIRNNESIIITDPKGEIAEEMKTLLEENQYNVKVLNLDNLEIGDQWNPLDLVKDDDDALDLASVLVEAGSGHNGDQFWNEAMKSYFQAIILYIVHELPPTQRHPGNILEIAARWGAKEENIDTLFTALGVEHPARRAYELGFKVAEDKVRAGILITASAKLALWQSQNVCNLTSGKGINIEEIGKEKTALFLILSASKTTMRPVSKLFFNQLFPALFRVAKENKGELPVKVRILADELGNIGKIHDLPNRLSITRAAGIGFLGIFQNFTQMETLYPDYKSIKDNCKTFVFLGGGDNSTLRYVSDSLGEQTIQTQSDNESERTTMMDTQGSMGLSISTSKRMLMTPDEIGRMDQENLIVQLAGHFPAMMQKYDYKKHPLAKGLVKQTLTKEMFPRRAKADLFPPPPEQSNDKKETINF